MGSEEAFHSGDFQGAERQELERVRVRLPSSPHVFLHSPVLSDPPILPLPPPHAISPGTTRGGGLRRRPPQSPARTPQSPNAPSTRSGESAEYLVKGG